MKYLSRWQMLFAGFVVGSFAGAAFGLLFAVSLTPARLSGPAVSAPADRTAATVEDASVVSAVKKVSPSVVSIRVYKDIRQLYNTTGPFFFQEFFGNDPFVPAEPEPEQGKPSRQVVGGGSGFVMTSDGLILTNRHVVADETAEYEVILQDGESHPATVLARDAILDLAVLKIEASGLTEAELGSSAGLEIGETVIAIGNALAEYQNTVTKGVVSGINRRVVAGGNGFTEVIEEAIQTDAAINPGNSGGPLVDLLGRVVGVNTAVNREGQSIGFAIPIDAAKIVIESIREHGRIVRPWLGVRYVIVTPEMAQAEEMEVDHGALIVKGSRPTDVAIVKDSPAEKAGLRENDIILSIDGETIDSDHALSGVIAGKNAGDTITLIIHRNGEDLTLTAVLGEVPEGLR